MACFTRPQNSQVSALRRICLSASYRTHDYLSVSEFPLPVRQAPTGLAPGVTAGRFFGVALMLAPDSTALFISVLLVVCFVLDLLTKDWRP